MDQQQVMSRLSSSSRANEVIDMDLVATANQSVGNGV